MERLERGSKETNAPRNTFYFYFEEKFAGIFGSIDRTNFFLASFRRPSSSGKKESEKKKEKKGKGTRELSPSEAFYPYDSFGSRQVRRRRSKGLFRDADIYPVRT